MIIYIVSSAIIWGVSTLFYTILLRQEKYFDYNRIFLLSTIVLGLVIPILPNLHLFNSGTITTIGSILHINLPEIIFSTTKKPTSFTYYSFIYHGVIILYLTGSIIVAYFLIKSLFSLKRYCDNGNIIHYNGYKLVILREPIVAFSFMNTIFINKEIYEGYKKNDILAHEKVHINQRHSYDILLIEILKIFFWFNPFVYLYKKFLAETHEYTADNYVIQKIPKKTYGELLINQLQSGVQYKIANYFINSLITIVREKNKHIKKNII